MGDNPPPKPPLPPYHTIIAPHIVKKGNYELKLPLTYPKMLYTFPSKKSIVMEQGGGRAVSPCNPPNTPQLRGQLAPYIVYNKPLLEI